MRIREKIVVTGLLLAFSPLSHAESYMGIGGTSSEYQYSDVKRGYGLQAFAGYRFDGLPIMIEAGYLDGGKNKINDFSQGGVTGTDASLAFQGLLLTTGFFGRFDTKGSGFYAKLGYYTGKSKGTGTFNGVNYDNSESSSGLTFDLGFDWMLTPNFGIRTNIGSLQKVKDLPQLGVDHKSNVTLAGIGLIFAFGGAQHSYPASRSLFDNSPAVNAATPQSSATAIATAGAAIHGQPSANASVTAVLKEGGTVTLASQRVDNAEGSWWFIRSGDSQGWINQKDLQSYIGP
ncbi:MAG: hypothetical protein E6R07_01805 [Nevskiaceae bacterium]|nr:MAG: hypothetical protein E6R07_01805 [Nevskiaceae bacterium]